MVLYWFIISHCMEHQRFPTYREVMLADIGFNSTSHVQASMHRLEEMGLIKPDGIHYVVVGGKWVPPEIG